MNLEDIIRAWKSDEQPLEPHLPVSPVGRELSEEELLDVFGSCLMSPPTCAGTCFVGNDGDCSNIA